MAKLSSSLAKRIAAKGFTTKSEEEARKEILAYLVKNGLEDMEEEETDTLVDVIESMIDDDSDDAPQTEEEEADDLADEVEEEEEEEAPAPKKKAAPAAKKAPAKKAVVEEEDEEEDEDEAPAPKKKSTPAPKKSAKKVVEDEEEEDEDEAPAPKKKAAAPAKKASAKKVVEEEEEDEEEAPAPKKKVDKKAGKKAPAKSANKRGRKLDPKNNEEDRELFAPLHKLFPEKDFLHAWVASAGVTIKHKGTNSQRSMALIENCSELENGDIRCNLFLLTFTKKTDILDEAGIEYTPCWNGAPLIKAITLAEAVEILKSLLDEITSDVKKIDKKLGDNRKKMEADLEKKAKPTAKAKPAPKKVEVEEEEDEEEEYEDDENVSLDNMSRAELKTFIKDNELDVKVLKSMTEDDIREAIAEAMEDEEEEEEEAPAPKKKASKK